jgi:hypothetical protein
MADGNQTRRWPEEIGAAALERTLQACKSCGRAAVGVARKGALR